jgi:hypothetical protein
MRPSGPKAVSTNPSSSSKNQVSATSGQGGKSLAQNIAKGIFFKNLNFIYIEI